MKYIKTYEKNTYKHDANQQFSRDDIIMINREGKDIIMKILDVIDHRKSTGYMGLVGRKFLSDDYTSYGIEIYEIIKKLTPDEIKIYVDTNKYNL